MNGVANLAFAPGNSFVTLKGTGQWLDAYFELPAVIFNGVNQGPQAAARFRGSPAAQVHISRVRYAVIRPCGPYAGVNLLSEYKPVAEFGDTTVSGFQDTFGAATRNTNWVALGAGGDGYQQGGGLSKSSPIKATPITWFMRGRGTVMTCRKCSRGSALWSLVRGMDPAAALGLASTPTVRA